MQDRKPYQKELPDKLYFRVGEASEIAEVPAYVLRFWETEFKRIKPKRTPSGHRLYRKSDMELILKIKYLLHEKKFTIQGARQYLRDSAAGEELEARADKLAEIRSELKKIRDLLS